MKDRILHYLNDFTKGKSEELALEIIQELKEEGVVLKLSELKGKSAEVLQLLLHHYSEFSISTIDAFFQKVIRSFTRETGLLGNFRLEVDNALVLEEVIDLLMDELGENKELRGWVLDFSMEKLIEGENWDVRAALLDFAKLIEKEEFKTIEDSILKATDAEDFFKSLRKKLNEEVYSVEKTVFGKANAMMEEFHQHHLEISDFKYGSTGSIYAYVRKLTKEIELPGKRITETIELVTNWPSKTENREVIISLAEKRWLPQLRSLIEFVEINLEAYLSASKVLQNLYAFGLLSDIVKMQKKYLSSENLMLLSDAPKFLNALMKEQDASFIYEKVGSFYRHYLLDEFQDTSGLQWNNLLPLIKNGLSQNYKSLIVGDIKQSIYRWRGGDLSILQEQVKQDVNELLVQSHTLDTNYRSDGNIVNFNNALFNTASQIIGKHSDTEFPQAAYADSSQQIFKDSTLGYVKIQFLNSTEEKISFEDQSLQQLPYLLEELQEKNVPLKEIAFLVRDNKEGQEIAARFMEYRASVEAKEDCKYDVVSNESLQLDRASCVLVLINSLKVLDNPNHQIARAHLAYEYQKIWPTQAFTDLNEIFSESKTKSFSKWVPSPFLQQHDRLASLPLFEMVENLIHIFNLGTMAEEIVYLQSFQDVVQEFSQREKNDLTSFLTWWEINKTKKSVQVAGGVEAAQIITIHRSKGLQFKYVIIPFLNWDLGHGTKDVMLWCKSDHRLFKDAGYIPVKYTKSLSETVFKNDYEQETKRVYLDNLNLLYVAFTRAEMGLIAYAPMTKTDSLNRVSQLMNKAIEQNEFLQAAWSDEEQLLQLGEINYTVPLDKCAENTLSLKNYLVTPWRDRLTVRTQGMEFFRPLPQRKKINYGIFLHAILSRICVKEDIERAINHAIKTGMIAEVEKDEITEMISWVVYLPQLQPCFDEKSVCKMEASLFTTDGTERRIDRVSFQKEKAWVVDYKTGDAKPKDEAQVKEYLNLLLAFGMQEVVGFLVYVQDRNCIEVKV